MTTEQFEQAKPCPFCGEGATAEDLLIAYDQLVQRVSSHEC